MVKTIKFLPELGADPRIHEVGAVKFKKALGKWNAHAVVVSIFGFETASKVFAGETKEEIINQVIEWVEEWLDETEAVYGYATID